MIVIQNDFVGSALRTIACLVKKRSAQRTLLMLIVISTLSTHAQPAATQPATITATGTVAAFYSVDLYSKESGFISEISKDLGDHVKAGELLATIDNPELLQQLEAVKAMASAKQEMVKAAEAVVHQTQAAVSVAVWPSSPWLGSWYLLCKLL